MKIKAYVVVDRDGDPHYSPQFDRADAEFEMSWIRHKRRAYGPFSIVEITGTFTPKPKRAKKKKEAA